MNRAGSAPGLLSRLPHSAKTSSTSSALTHSVSAPSRTSSANPVHGCTPASCPRPPSHGTIVRRPQATALDPDMEVEFDGQADDDDAVEIPAAASAARINML